MRAGYGRVSKAEDQDTAAQRGALQRARCDLIVLEEASGATLERPKLRKLLAQLGQGDELVVWRVDRLSRSARDLLNLVDQLTAAGIRFRSLTEIFDTSTAAGRLMFQTLAAFSEFDRRSIVDRTKLGLDHARRAGRVGGRRRKLSPAQVEDAVVLLERKSIAQVAASLSVSAPTLKRALRRRREAQIVESLERGPNHGKKSPQKSTGASRDRGKRAGKPRRVARGKNTTARR